VAANSEAHCTACAAGSYQPISGAANYTLCVPCARGNYSSVTGASSCELCPSGSWGGSFGMTQCTWCGAGKWSRSPHAIRADMCLDCGAGTCGAGSSASVVLEVSGMDSSSLSASQVSQLSGAYAADIAAAGGFAVSAVRDLGGQSAAASLSGPGLRITSLVTVPSGEWVTDLAAALAAPGFAGRIVNSTAAALSSASGPFVLTRTSVEPAAYTTTTSTLTVTSTQTATTTTATTTSTSTATATSTSSETLRGTTAEAPASTTPEAAATTSGVAQSTSSGTSAVETSSVGGAGLGRGLILAAVLSLAARGWSS